MKNLLSSNIHSALFTALLLFFGASSQVAYTKDFDHSYEAYNQVLKRYVNNGLVDYISLKDDQKNLNLFLTSIALLPKKEFKEFSKQEQLALLINFYNAQTLK